MFRFSIRDVLWLTVVVGIGCAWWVDRRLDGTQKRWQLRAEYLASVCRNEGWWVEWHGDSAGLTMPPVPGPELLGARAGKKELEEKLRLVTAENERLKARLAEP